MRLRRGRTPEPAPEPQPATDQAAEFGAGDLLVEEATSAETVTVLASVNLLPRTYALRAAVRRAKVTAAIMVAGALLLSLLGWLVAWQKEAAAQEALDIATAERNALQAEANRYAEVPRVFSAVADARSQLGVAMGNEVRWSFFLNDLALTMPRGVSLETLALSSPRPGESQQAVAPSAVSAARAGATTSGVGMPGIGTMSVSAKAFTYNHVANWLDAIAKLPTVADPYVGTIAAGSEYSTKIVTFTSTSTITPDALSRRYETKGVAQ